MKKEKVELWRINNHPHGYGIIQEPKHDINESILEFCNTNNVKYCLHSISYEEEPYIDGRFVKRWHYSDDSFGWKYSHEYFVGCELQPEKIRKRWKFGDYVKYVTIYYEEK